jgi:YHS domain-containing protein
VISFIFADLIILPILNIYRKYYGGRMSLYLLVVSYLAMALAGFLVGGAFQLLGLVPTNHHVAILEAQPTWNYTTFLDIASLGLMAGLAWRFFKTDGVSMLRAMSHPPQDHAQALKDPVCGMSVDPVTATEKVDYMGNTYYFCSAGCRTSFARDPARYASGAANAENGGHEGHSHP